MMDAPAIQAEGVAKTYGRFSALRGVSMTLEAGAFLTLFGANGAGKTTFLKIVATLARPTHGRLRVGGFDAAERPEEVRRRIGFLSHNTGVYRDLTPLENLRFYSRLYGRDDGDPALEALLERVGLEDRRHDAVRTFSRGLLQRVGLARVMLHRPALLLLDEPHTGLDARAVAILNAMLDEAVEGGRTVVVTTHDLELGLRAATRVEILDRGRIVYSGSGDADGARAAYDRHIRREAAP